MCARTSSIILHPYSWEIVDDNRTSIRVWCKDQFSQTHLVRYEDYAPFAIVELPVYIRGHKHMWDETTAYNIFNAIAGLKGAGNPTSYEFFMGERLYGFQVHPSPFLKLYFPNLKSMNKCKYRIDRGIKYENTLLRLKLHETTISLKNKLATERNVSLAFWQRITGFHPQTVSDRPQEKSEIRKDVMGNVIYSSDNTPVQISKLPAEREWIADYRKLEPVKPAEIQGWQFYYSELGVDAEQYSNNHRIFPDAWNINHAAFMLSCNFQIQLQSETRERYCIVLGSVNHIPEEKLSNATIIEVSNETQILEQLH
jgi:hypothetical protein